jgi:hypothetical protein
VEEKIRLCLLGCHPHPLPQQPELHSLRYYVVGDEAPLGHFFFLEDWLIMHSKGARKAAASALLGPRIRI